MSFYKKAKDFVLKLQNLPDQKKKIIFFTAISIIAAAVTVFEVISFRNNLPKLTKSIQSINLPEIGENSLTVENIQINQKEAKVDGSGTRTIESSPNQLTYYNEKYNFSLSYPDNWIIDKKQTTDYVVWFEMIDLIEVADIHIEVVSQTQSIKSIEQAMDRTTSQFKSIIEPEKKINIAGYNGYEVIGTTCTKECNNPTESQYSPFSIIYFSDDKEVFKIKYGEGIIDLGWKKTIDNWKYYDEYQKIISTLEFAR